MRRSELIAQRLPKCLKQRRSNSLLRCFVNAMCTKETSQRTKVRNEGFRLIKPTYNVTNALHCFETPFDPVLLEQRGDSRIGRA